MCKEGEGVRVKRYELGTETMSVAGKLTRADRGGLQFGIDSVLAHDLGMKPDREYLLVATEVEPTWPVVVQYRPWLRVSKPQTFIACGQCGADFGFATSPVPTRCHSCQAKLVGSIPQAEVAALLRREGGAA